MSHVSFIHLAFQKSAGRVSRASGEVVVSSPGGESSGRRVAGVSFPEVYEEGAYGGCLRGSLLSPCYSECVLWPAGTGSTQELGRNAESQAATPGHGI